MKKFEITIEGIKRITIPVPAKSKEEAETMMIEKIMKNEIEFEYMFDSIRITNIENKG